MSWQPEIPPREEVETAFPRDVFDGAFNAIQRTFWLDLHGEPQDRFLQRVGSVEEQLQELILIWNRLGDDRITQIETMRRAYAIRATVAGTNYTIGSGENPDLDESYAAERMADVALWLDYKSLFLFADILVTGYVRMSDVLWEAPPAIDDDSFSKFLWSVRTTRAAHGLPAPFSEYMAVLFDRMVAVDNEIGFYRDKFITHLPPDMLMVSSGGSLGVPLSFHVDHGRHRAVTEAELRALGRELERIDQAEGVPLRSDSDPRHKLRAYAQRLGNLRHETSVRAIQDLLREWGMTSPPALQVVKRLNELLTLWADLIVEKVGLVDPGR